MSHAGQVIGVCRVLCGDALEVLATLPDCSIDAIVTDPPYGLEFMDKKWDSFGGEGRFAAVGIGARERPWPTHGGLATFGAANPSCKQCGGRLRGRKRCMCMEPEWYVNGKRIEAGAAKSGAMLSYTAWCAEWGTQVLRVLKPGGHLVAFGGTRTHHRLMCALEGAGFEIRDTLMWLYASGFPKSLNVGKALDKMAGAEREVLAPSPFASRRPHPRLPGSSIFNDDSHVEPAGGIPFSTPATDAAQQWNGWGTALKPAWEIIVLARKPLSESTVAANVLKWGTGALNIDACRIEGESWGSRPAIRLTSRGKPGGGFGQTSWETIPGQTNNDSGKGRWPANVVHDASEEVVGLFPESATEYIEKPSDCNNEGITSFQSMRGNRPARGYDGVGSAARFFYAAKVSPSERGENNTHPTVKPLALMRWLVRLVTHPGGLVLDPFLGSGTTALACRNEGMRCIGIEREPEYYAMACRRIEEAYRQGDLFMPSPSAVHPGSASQQERLFP